MAEIIKEQELLILIRLIASHLCVDFLMQPDKWVKDKEQKKFKSLTLYLHGSLAGLVAYLFSGAWNNISIPLVIAITHILIDGWKSYRTSNAKYFVIDQILHLAVILIMWSIYFQSSHSPTQLINLLFNDLNLWVIVSGYLFALWPMAYLISFATKRWRNQIENQEKVKSLGDAGKWIGRIERFLIVTFVLLSRFDAIGFLIAAKSVFRFGDVKDSNDRREAEYILIGTLLSFALAIFLGIVMRMVMKN